MSDYDALTDDQDSDSQLVKDLRAQIKSLGSENKTLKTENETFKVEKRTASVADILKAKSINPKVAALIPSDVAADEGSVDKWLEEWGDVFGVKKDDAAEPGADPDEVANLARAQATSHNADAGTPPGISAELKRLQTVAASATDLDSFLAGLNG